MVRTSSENLEKDFGFYYFAKEVLIKKNNCGVYGK